MNNCKCPPKTVEEQICELYQILGTLQQRAFLDPAKGRGVWDSTTQYNAGDMVSLDGSSYFAIIASQGYSPAVSANIGVYWQPLAARGEPGTVTPGDTGNGISSIFTTGHTQVGEETITDLTVAYTNGESDEVEVHAQNGSEGPAGKSITSITLNGTAQSGGRTISNERVVFSDGSATNFDVEALNGTIEGAYMHNIVLGINEHSYTPTLVIINTSSDPFTLSSLRTYLTTHGFIYPRNNVYPISGAWEEDATVWMAHAIQAPQNINQPIYAIVTDESHVIQKPAITSITDDKIMPL